MIRWPKFETARRYWREGAYASAIVVPWLVMLPLGVLWLFERGWVLWWAAGAAALALFALRQRLVIIRSARDEAAALAASASPASREWGPREREAWRLVESASATTPPFLFLDAEPIRVAVLQLVDQIAAHYRPGVANARLQLTLPEALLLTERFARDVRAAALEHVPGSRRLLIGDALRFKHWAERWGPTASQTVDALDSARRIVRGVVNPAGAAIQESTRALLGKAGTVLALRARAALTALLLRECGRAAIDLYSGRLRLSAAELATAEGHERAPSGDLLGPIRILLAGQVNAGKSSLFNALAGRVQRFVGVTPSPEGAAEVTLALEGEAAVILRETTGLTADATGDKALIAEAQRVDLIVWVASATQPAREPDTRVLAALRAAFSRSPERRPPPILCAVTHIDELSPKAEWAPPYDLGDTSRAKAQRIRAAVEHVAQVLVLPEERCTPISVRADAEPYGVTLLWAQIGAQFDEARFAKLDRMVFARHAGGLRETLRQAWSAGRALSSMTFPGKRRSPIPPTNTG